MEHNFKKKYGQNFITDTNLLSAIVKDSNIDNNSLVIEVGAGAGTLTKELAKAAKNVISFEIDTELKKTLTKIAENNKNVQIEFKDFMQADILDYTHGQEFYVVANVPYYITTAIISKFIEVRPKVMTLMVQKEVAERLCASPKTSSYGAMSVICQSVSSVSLIREVNKKMFTPMPEVDSCIIKFEFNDNSLKEDYINFVRGCFMAKRKTLLNNLSNYLNKSKTDLLTDFNVLNLSEKARAEDLTNAEFIKVYNYFNKI